MVDGISGLIIHRPTAGQEMQKYISGDLTAEEALMAMDDDWKNMTTQ